MKRHSRRQCIQRLFPSNHHHWTRWPKTIPIIIIISNINLNFSTRMLGRFFFLKWNPRILFFADAPFCFLKGSGNEINRAKQSKQRACLKKSETIFSPPLLWKWIWKTVGCKKYDWNVWWNEGNNLLSSWMTNLKLMSFTANRLSRIFGYYFFEHQSVHVSCLFDRCSLMMGLLVR